MSRHEAGEACRSQSVRVSCSFCSHRNGWGSCVLPQRRHEVILPKIEQAAAEEPRPPRPGRTLLCLGTCTCDFGTTAWSPRRAHIWVTPFTSCAAPSRVAFLRGKPALGTCVWAPLWLVRLRGCPPGPPLCAPGSLWNTAHLPHVTPHARAWHKSLHGPAGGDPEGTLHWSVLSPVRGFGSLHLTKES